MEFGEYIRSLREKRNLLLREMAANVNMDVAYLSKIERGNRMARREQVIAFAKELKEDENKLIKLWMSEQIVQMIKNEKDSTEILKIAEEKISKIVKKQ
ncbi:MULTISPECIES: helix-turn-helix domain-containing protein [Winogradskyella]|jgi:transcriptional regulator with XRE-family HTH domain|uniref:Helix-turn-helix protein n=1 Tax=Winogradskyella wandonensis TaxID=1442586 RepID=A0A4R1KW57_9FLAO|nr:MULTISPECIES: helix-turn-helix transcriptional regulator [Winogradskyella]MCR9182886.1 helix-turn-helix domain-containing protein [Flavobacteriaceae bacterium]TCK69442.1 helix-turn-helix protein [Winogradskyella wandonensis]